MAPNPSNKKYIEVTNLLRKTAHAENVPLWRRVRELLYRPRRRRIAVNISKINRHTSEGDVVIIPGKVLGSGNIDHRIKIAAYDYSLTAKKKLKEAGCEVLSISELINENPRGKGVKIIV